MSSQLDGAPFISDDSTAMDRQAIVDAQMADAPLAELQATVSVMDTGASCQMGGETGWGLLSTLVYLALMIASLYLAFRCARGFNIWQLLLAFFFPICYIPYGLYACL